MHTRRSRLNWLALLILGLSDSEFKQTRRKLQMRNNVRLSSLCGIGFALLMLCSSAQASTFTFNKDPFAGTPVLTTPGRQIVGGEDFISFSPTGDVFTLDPNVFKVGNTVNFVDAAANGIPTGGVNVVVLDQFDNDNNPLTPFGAGQAADLIADRITTPGAGFFIYFNQALNLPRLVYSTDLSDNNADLKVLARMINLSGDEGRNAMPEFSARNFEFTTATPEPSSLLLIFAMGALGACAHILRRRSKPTCE
jgi:PEP-CTERM motif